VSIGDTLRKGTFLPTPTVQDEERKVQHLSRHERPAAHKAIPSRPPLVGVGKVSYMTTKRTTAIPHNPNRVRMNNSPCGSLSPPPHARPDVSRVIVYSSRMQGPTSVVRSAASSCLPDPIMFSSPYFYMSGTAL